jgi:hypothetical protein
MIDKVLDRVVQQLDEKVGRLQEAVGAGAAKDFSEYQKMCGEVQGLLTARLFITDLKKNLEQTDDE